MDNLTDKMLFELVKSLEICQQQVISQKIDPESYYSLTKVKFELIEKILRKQSDTLPSDKNLILKLNKLRLSNLLICSILDEVCI